MNNHQIIENTISLQNELEFCTHKKSKYLFESSSFFLNVERVWFSLIITNHSELCADRSVMLLVSGAIYTSHNQMMLSLLK